MNQNQPGSRDRAAQLADEALAKKDELPQLMDAFRQTTLKLAEIAAKIAPGSDDERELMRSGHLGLHGFSLDQLRAIFERGGVVLPQSGGCTAQLTASQRALMDVDLKCPEAKRLQHALGEIVKPWRPPFERHHELRSALNRLVVYVLHTRRHPAKDSPGAKEQRRALDKVAGHAAKLHEAMAALHPATRDELEHAGVPFAHLLSLMPHLIEASAELQQVAPPRGAPKEVVPLTVAIHLVNAYAVGTGRNPYIPGESDGLTRAIAETFALLGIEADAEHYQGKAAAPLSKEFPSAGRILPNKPGG